MRKLLCIAFMIFFYSSFSSAQNSLKFNLSKLQIFTAFTIIKTVYSYPDFSLNKQVVPSKEANRIACFIENLPQIKLKTIGNKFSFAFYTELSFSDMIEGAFKNANSGLINTYDDNITGLYKNAPFLLKLKCCIHF